MSNESENTDSTKPATEWQFIDASNNSRSNLTQVKRHVMQQYMRQKRASGQSSNDVEQTAVESHNAPRKATRRPRKARASAGGTAQKGKKEDLNSQRQKNASAEKSDVQVVPNQELTDDLVEEIERDFIPGVMSYTSAENASFPANSFFQLQGYPISPYLLDKYASGSQSSGSESSSLSPWSSTPTSPSDVTLSPKTILSAARTDPFNTLPMDLDAEGQRLFDFYVNEMPACSYGSHFRSAKAHNWYTAVFVPEGMKGAVTFQNTILVHAANTWAWVRNEEETDYTLVHRNRAISMLRDHMTRHPGDISDVAIIACLSAAGLEDFDPRPGHKEISWVHMRAAREMIRARGGPAAFENTRLGMLINWQDYILSGYETNGLSFFFDPSYSLSFLSPEDEIRHQCDEFIDFLKRCEELSVSHRSKHANMPALVRYSAFQETSLLYSILAAPPGLRFTASGNRKQFVARLVALIMLNAALWDYRNSVQHSETFLWTLEQAVLASEVDTSGSVEALLQIMLECRDGITITDMSSTSSGSQGMPDFTQYSPTAKTQYGRPWFAGRMLKVAKRLSLNSWMIVHDFLFSCLTLRLETPVCLWERELRQEILSAPLTSYIMPALAE
ncbi:sigma-70 region 2 family protein [Aspergillus flavus]|uniref:Sigma-70 region 2 family protein n=1 Tax=Aspergillus flavus (strain ATCC 200026 / FGSC A1120 / IAM 13836 / NRRL 3357 / JCM 12722 / SRRC 167) TaxID=332952 RepID=A0A7U2QSD1_ASPFN|nr:sigma-70 region 2 family protein [Aspergillus flavus]